MPCMMEKFAFKTKDDAADDAFITAAAKSSDWFKQQDGFAYRTLVREADGTWSDLIFWTSEQAAKTAGPGFMGAPQNVDYMSMVDMPSVTHTTQPQLLVALGGT